MANCTSFKILTHKQEGLARLSSIETMPEFKNNGNYCHFSFVYSMRCVIIKIAALKNSSYETARKIEYCTDLYLKTFRLLKSENHLLKLKNIHLVSGIEFWIENETYVNIIAQ